MIPRRALGLVPRPPSPLRSPASAHSARRHRRDLHNPRRLLESNPAGGRAVAVTNIRGKDAPALRLAFAKVGSIEAVELGEDERGAPTASIIFDEELGAIRAVEELNDEDNWRFGMRVRLESGMALLQQGRPRACRPAQGKKAPVQRALRDGGLEPRGGAAASTNTRRPGAGDCGGDPGGPAARQACLFEGRVCFSASSRDFYLRAMVAGGGAPSPRHRRARPDAQASSASSGRATPSPRTTTRFLI